VEFGIRHADETWYALENVELLKGCFTFESESLMGKA
jgi:hypothetical protein